MNINNFESHIDEIILDRGYDYYISGNILKTYKKDDNEYIFEIEGSEYYEVMVEITDAGEIIGSICNCPFDFGPICKHEAAAFYKLYELLGNELNDNKDIEEEVMVNPPPKIKDVLEELPKEELIDIILNLTKNNATLKDKIILRYSKDDDTQVVIKCKELINLIVRKHTEIDGYISYREAYDFINDMRELFDKVRDTYQENKKPLLAIDIAFIVLEEAINAFDYADDSSGEIGGFVYETIELIGEVARNSEEFDNSTREKMFTKLLELSNRNMFGEWDYELEILDICTEFSDIEELRNRLKMKLESMVKDDYSKYSCEQMLLILFRIIDGYGTQEEAEEFIKTNINYTSYRKLLINKYVKEENYQKVIDLTLEAEKKDADYAGLVRDWKMIRYSAYKKLSLIEEREKLAKELFFDGCYEYYEELKSIHKKDESAFYNKIKEELRNHKGWRAKDIFIKIIVDEEDLDEIIEVVRKDPNTIESYAEILISKYKDEVKDIYKKSIRQKANAASSRNQYKGICRMLRRFKKVAGKENQDEMVNELVIAHKRRPAFLDELSRV